MCWCIESFELEGDEDEEEATERWGWYGSLVSKRESEEWRAKGISGCSLVRTERGERVNEK